ncbi:MAG: DUF4037 domain-containing protein [Caldilinea sp.]|uniref:DUF4037 domain-containing protein n=1 Tax=Caldilinea sp. TaxID=2293560 RepID=UPI003099AEAD
MRESILDVSRQFFEEVLLPILRRDFPEETAQTAFGVFGYGSEVMGMDDQFSSDHHWGIRVNAVMPDALYYSRGYLIAQSILPYLPERYRGYDVRAGFSGGTGLSITGLESYLKTTIGIDHAPQTYAEWLSAPEEDIVHVINGEVWLDELGRFSHVRTVLQGYYPEPVRLRRIAHWCRYFSGMGSYALKRALLRNNEYYATITFSRAVRWAVQLCFMLEKRYYPYDKWTYAFFQRLPRLYEPMAPLVDEAVRLSTPWERKLELLNRMADVIDHFLVADGVIQPHPKFAEHPSSGYRLLEHAYAEILHQLPAELRAIVPVWEQVHWEANHSQYVASLDMATWDGLLNLHPIEEGRERVRAGEGEGGRG